ncbi:hypothetical protein BG011_009700 [Mortierella polycephala]|uniref:Uncharacterized protein n=1 Tax=Mortierella polycephala TaxID=41804 RepID=A0A9P6Q869_9FUNG|nr:hypothetical protein BG011_009700 [Mortierella polycephala]
MAVESQHTSLHKTVDLGDGLVMRWSTKADTENVASLVSEAFKWFPLGVEVPDDRVPGPNEFMRAGVRRLLSGKTPTMSENHYALVEDTKRKDGENPIVACVSLHTVSGFYGSINLPFGKPELIATDPDYRNRGLVRKLLLGMVHPESEARGDILQFIPGIGYFYRQFGYDYGLSMAGASRIETPDMIPRLPKDKSEPYTLRQATLEDLPFLNRLSTRERLHANIQVGAYYTNEYWKYTVHDAFQEKQSIFDCDRDTRIITEVASGRPVGFTIMSFAFFGTSLEAMALEEDAVVVDMTDSVLRQLFAIAKDHMDELNQGRDALSKKNAPAQEQQAEASKASETKADDKPAPISMSLRLHPKHPLIVLLGNKALRGPENIPSGFRLYTRIHSYPAFIKAVKPELEKRLANSALAGVSGHLRLDFFRKVEGCSGKGLEIVLEKGKIVEAKDWAKPTFEKLLEESLAWKKAGNTPVLYQATFSPLTFTSLLTGKNTLEELQWSYPENNVKGDNTRLLLNTLFPKVDQDFDVFFW